MTYLLIILFSIILFILVFYLKRIFFISQEKEDKHHLHKRKCVQIDDRFLVQNKNSEYNLHYFTNKKVVITGEFRYFKTRNELALLLWENGAIIDKEVTLYTDVLLVGKRNFDSTKLNKAFSLNIKVLDEELILSYFPNLKFYKEPLTAEPQLN